MIPTLGHPGARNLGHPGACKLPGVRKEDGPLTIATDKRFRARRLRTKSGADHNAMTTALLTRSMGGDKLTNGRNFLHLTSFKKQIVRRRQFHIA